MEKLQFRDVLFYGGNGNNIQRTDIEAAGVTLRQVTDRFEQTLESVVNLRARMLQFSFFNLLMLA